MAPNFLRNEDNVFKLETCGSKIPLLKFVQSEGEFEQLRNLQPYFWIHINDALTCPAVKFDLQGLLLFISIMDKWRV